MRQARPRREAEEPVQVRTPQVEVDEDDALAENPKEVTE